MSHEKSTASQEPDAWVPSHSVFGFSSKNLKDLREGHERRWQNQADKHNKARPLVQKLTGKDKITAASIMEDEARADNAQIDVGETPDSLKRAKLGHVVLEEAGIEQKHFPTREALQQAELDSPVVGRGTGKHAYVSADALAEATSRAMEKVGIVDDPVPQNPYAKH